MFVKDVKDRKDRDFDAVKQTYMKKLKEVGIEEIKEIIPFRQLRLEFEPFEARRKLSDAFDGYLGDERIYHLLRGKLGKHFTTRHKMPVSVRLTSQDFKACVQKALRTSLLTVTKRGACSSLYIGSTSINSEDELVENILSAWEQIETRVPGGQKNIRSLVIKTGRSMAIPIFVDMDYDTKVEVPDLRSFTEEPEAEEIDTISGAKVQVFADGRVKLLKSEEKDDEFSDVEEDRMVQKMLVNEEKMEKRAKRKERRDKYRKDFREKLAEKRKAKKLSKADRPLLKQHKKEVAV